MSGFEHSRRKLNEARYFLGLMERHIAQTDLADQSSRDVFGYQLSAFLSAASSARNLIAKEDQVAYRRGASRCDRL